MGWVHSHRRHGASVALAALMLQIAVSFGHVDLGGIVGSAHLTLAGPHATVLAKASRSGPAQNSGDDDDGYCPICASIFLVATSFVAAPPQLTVPDGFERISHAVSVAPRTAVTRRVVFRSRAPPAA